ncbi:MAG: threonylcarbamoyl-AMP synthase [Anaerolineales bacterium]|nr:threonylcarbamoyl-AMP synthase [Anaerolineales bacterium]MCB8939312.1 threonylcarbamoyl-AMP synthase [Ardenticatenaceae bacterium]
MERLQRPYPPDHTKLLPASQPGAIMQAAAEARAGNLIVIPTDTLYGLACDAFNPEAVRLIYAAKQRPYSKPIPILLADSSDLPRVVRSVPPVAQAFINQYWPGPLTILLPKHPDLPEEITDNNSVAIRIPDSEVGRAIIRATGGAMAVTSANLTGQEPAETAPDALQKLAGWVTAVVDDGPSPHGAASTILDCTGHELKILREGPISAQSLLGIK